ncbi:TPA: helix-turn-helix transcriptional regulator [Morganella morganii]|uniref:Helix-turn-helix transcriptional regulator n=1 Tax=Morganella morganii TaxID=582 RepID=A0A9Q4CSP4_MORMO|nr:helix-turn-helix transcriptional regulator [Morganella morganii]MCY0790891.1 helix-turn-helix transcriptional regulator [Morganella morganii]HCU0243920.1 helix-turn-helix transcriptional regulator [Morganella morganii]
MTDISLIVGRKIRELRLHHCLTTRQLADSTGISQQQMSRYERGVNRIHVDVLYSLSLVFGCKVNDFFSDIPSPAEASYYDEYGAAASAVIESAVDIKVPIRTADKGQ